MNITQSAFDYSIRIAELVRHLRSEDRNFPLCDTLLTCGVDAGFYLLEPSKTDKAIYSLNKADYIIQMAVTAGYLTEQQTVRIRGKGQELVQMIHENEGGAK